MTQNMFAVETQAELNSLIHRPQDDCPGDCDWCRKFHRAAKVANAFTTENELSISLTENEKPIAVTNGYYQVWCNVCSDGENSTFWECCDWAENHAKGRHNIKS